MEKITTATNLITLENNRISTFEAHILTNTEGTGNDFGQEISHPLKLCQFKQICIFCEWGSN
jgi:hypothetical protein